MAKPACGHCRDDGDDCSSARLGRDLPTHLVEHERCRRADHGIDGVQLGQQGVAKVGHVRTAHDGDEVVLAGAIISDSTPGTSTMASRAARQPCWVILRKTRAQIPKPSSAGSSGRREPGDRPDPPQSLDPGVGRRAGDVAARRQLGERHPSVADQGPEEGPVDVVDLSVESARVGLRRDICSNPRAHRCSIVRTLGVSLVEPSKPTRLSAMATFDSSAPVVELADDHPGVSDLEYLARRDEIARAALGLQPGEAARVIAYTDEEDETWATAATSARRTAPPARLPRRSSTASPSWPSRLTMFRNSPTCRVACSASPVARRRRSRPGPDP